MLTCIVVFIVDLSGFVQSMKKALVKFRIIKDEYVQIKPFDCSLCMSWWIGLIYIYLNNQFTISGVFLVSMFAFITPLLNTIIHFITDTIGLFINKLSEKM